MNTAVFTRDNPCTKVHIWNAFRRPGSPGVCTVVDARALIGLNTPKYLLREGFMTLSSRGGVDYYTLTPAGETWLNEGIVKHLKRHPSDAAGLLYPVPGVLMPRPPTRRIQVVRRR